MIILSCFRCRSMWLGYLTFLFYYLPIFFLRLFLCRNVLAKVYGCIKKKVVSVMCILTLLMQLKTSFVVLNSHMPQRVASDRHPRPNSATLQLLPKRGSAK
jgi:hypothetical protein